MQRVLGLATMTLLVACAPRHQPGAAPTTGDTAVAELLTPATDLSGHWVTGSDNEPPPGPVVQQPSCAYNPPVWIVQQAGNALKAWAIPESFNQGIKLPGPGPERIQAVPGTISGNTVVLAGPDVRFILDYDAGSGHLRGTRNGAPFWAARQSLVRTECPGIP